MVLMLPIATDNGARLAAILPTGIAALSRRLGFDAVDALARSRPGGVASDVENTRGALAALPEISAFVLVVVDGLGHANLQARRGHARTLASLPARRIETVIPTTTGAALTSLTTGALPGEHGLIGYRIRHPELGVVSTLKDWGGIADRAAWQRSRPLFRLAAELGMRPIAIGRPAHAAGGLTEAILGGAEYHGGQTIAERFEIAAGLLSTGEPVLAYLYVDELDKVAHSEGWQSDRWVRRLEQLDEALDGLLRRLPAGVGVAVTADHGIVDVPEHRRLMLDADEALATDVREFGGEPRMRSLYLHPGADPETVAARFAESLGRRAWVGTRMEAISAGWFGRTAPEVAERLGEVLVTPRGESALTLTTDSEQSLAMVGQHGGLSPEERGVPLALGGSLAGSAFASTVAAVAASAD